MFVADNVCLRPWAFERVPNKMIRGLDNALIYTSTKEACLAACLNEVCQLTYLDVNDYGKDMCVCMHTRIFPDNFELGMMSCQQRSQCCFHY